jgi:hypothetical protein
LKQITERRKRVSSAISALLLLDLLVILTAPQVTLAQTTITIEQPITVNVRQTPFRNEMNTRLTEYAQTNNWTKKIFPQDEMRLNNSEEKIYIEAYFSDIEEAIQPSTDIKTGKTETIFQVNLPSERAIEEAAKIPNTYFYVSRFSPSIGLTIEKQALQEIANIPSVYCIRIIPPLEPFLSISTIRELDDIAYTMANHDSTLDAATSIAVIDSGYDQGDSKFAPGPWASDNIMPNQSWDFTDSNTDVSNGENVHGSTVADTLTWGFGEVNGDNDAMYEDPNFWIPLKICDDSYSTASQYAPHAIEWCIAHDIDIVCMSFGESPFPFMYNPCNGWWCDRFRTGTLGGTTWVAAAGNAGRTNGVAYPAESHFVVAVGAYDNNPAQKESYSDYGLTFYRAIVYPGVPVVHCWPCFIAQGNTEFKPNAYECGYLGYWGWGAGTSYSAPLACADIAIGMYSPNNGEYTQGFEYLLDVIALSNEFPVSPSECSQQGDVIDTHTLWHRSQISP